MAVWTQARPTSLGRDPTSPWRHIDWVLVVCTIAVAVLGAVMVYSATRGRRADLGLSTTYYLVRQSVFVVGGVVAMAAVQLMDYRRLREFAGLLYIGAVAALLLVISPLGTTSKGAQNWFALGAFQLQPSEFTKLAVIVAVAALLAGDARVRDDTDGVSTTTFVQALLLVGLTFGLLMLQPDLGTALVFIAILVGMLLVAGVQLRWLVLLAVLGVVGSALVLNMGFLKEYQTDRLTAFLEPTEDTGSSAYNLNQSKIAIANGSLLGEGLFEGSQTNLAFVPEQHTDFIFTAVAEELGFVGAGTLLLVYGIMAWRIWRTAQLSTDRFGVLLCVGVVSMLVFQIFQNVGMTMGIMPITGIPLPFLSYGGSSTLAMFLAVGVVLNVRMRRFR